jgi:lipid II:glycine glycyltransferase (peptidoglycan interpeptide bridge formation enzyme)
MSTIGLELITEQAAWDAALLTLPEPHVLQSWTWGVCKEAQGWQARHLLWRGTEGQTVAVALVLHQRRGRLCLSYVPKGPLLDWRDIALTERVLSDLEAHARANRSLLLKIDPDVSGDTAAGQAVIGQLRRRGWRSSFEQIQFRNTMLLDLRPDLDTLMGQMKSKGRYNIRLAVRKGVTVREATEAELPLLYDLYAETAWRDRFIIREASYYHEVWRAFVRAGLALPLLAEVEGTPVAMLILFHFGQRAWYMYGASRDLHRETMPNHLLQWEAIRRAKALGCTVYDLWGAPDRLDESDPMWGVYRFKASLGAELVSHIGAYDYAPAPFFYRLYALLRPRLVALAQRRYWETAPHKT